MPWPFDRDYMQLALLAGLVVGACAPLIGAFLVQKRMSLMGDGLGHVAFAGVAAGLLFGVWPIWTALVAAVAGAVLIEWLRAHGRASATSRSRLCFYGGIALAVVLASRAERGQRQRVALPVRLDPHGHVGRRARRARTRGDHRRHAAPRRAGTLRDRPRRGVGTRRRPARRRAEHAPRRAHRRHDRGRDARRRRAPRRGPDGDPGGHQPPPRPVVPGDDRRRGGGRRIASVVIGLAAAREWELAPGGRSCSPRSPCSRSTATAAGVARRAGAGPVFPGA